MTGSLLSATHIQVQEKRLNSVMISKTAFEEREGEKCSKHDGEMKSQIIEKENWMSCDNDV